MGMDVDYIAAQRAIEKLERILSDVPHGEREKIADDIIDFAKKMKKKYSKNKDKPQKNEWQNKFDLQANI